jgi:serine/threonine protein phosphatase PrpC
MFMLFPSLKRKKTNIIFAAYTDRGNRPGENQDAVLAVRREDFSVFCVADGMGGHSTGELASAEIIRQISQWIDSKPENCKDKPGTLFDEFEATIEAANSTIYKTYNQGTICGSTVVSLLITQGKFCIVSVGDSRCYRRDGDQMQQITRDDVWQNQIMMVEDVSEEELQKHANYGKLLKSVGTSESLICNRIAGDIEKHDLFLLCSDGIYKVIGDENLGDLIRLTKDANTDAMLDVVLDNMHEAVLHGGAPDNNTGVIVKIVP